MNFKRWLAENQRYNVHINVALFNLVYTYYILWPEILAEN